MVQILTATYANKEVSFKDFLHVDSVVNVCEELMHADIIAECQTRNKRKMRVGMRKKIATMLILNLSPSQKEARQAINILCRFLESMLYLEENVFGFIDEIEEIVKRDASRHQCQTKLTDFFSIKVRCFVALFDSTYCR